jgi:hypothetical protein
MKMINHIFDGKGFGQFKKERGNKMKKSVKITSLLLSLLFCGTMGLTACDKLFQGNGNSENSDTPPAEVTTYNVIFALATIPPVLAAMDCIDNGYQTYAVI